MERIEVINRLMDMLVSEATALCGDKALDSDHVMNIVALNHALDKLSFNNSDDNPFANLKPGER